MKLSDALRRFRKDFNLTQQQVVFAIGCSYRAYQSYEAGTSVPSAAVLIAIADHYNISLDYLAGRSDDPRRR